MFPFVVVNCKDRKTLSIDTLLSSLPKEVDRQKGKSEAAHLSEGGTLFLYNCESLSKSDQTKVLKYLKARKLQRSKTIDHTATAKRIIVAASVNLKTLVDKGKFNKELYQIVSKRSIHIPPLRKRSTAIVPLAMHFIKSFNREYGKEVKRIDADVRHYLTSYDWPGNVSELKNVMEHVVIISQGDSISLKDMEFRADKKVLEVANRMYLPGVFMGKIVNQSGYSPLILRLIMGFHCE